MEIRYIREFLALAEIKNYAAASERMFVTASSLARHIKTLENDLGVPLLESNSHKVKLSRHGQAFLPFAKDFLRVDDECTSAFSEAADNHSIEVRLGVIPLMRAYRILELAAMFQSENKSTVLTIREAYSLTLTPMLRNEELDLAFLRDQDDPDNEFEKILFTQDRLCAVLPCGHPLAGRESISMHDLRGEPLLLIGKNPFLYRLCTDLCREAGFEPKVRFTSHHADSLIAMVKKGLGVALLMKKPISLLIPDDIRLVDISPEVKTRIFLARNVHHKLSKQAGDFWKLAGQLQETAGDAIT